MATTKISHGDDDYDDIHADWVTNGRPAQFDREGSWGGALYTCRDTSETYPDFYRQMSMLATQWSENSGNIIRKGWHLINEDYLREDFHIDIEGRVSVTRPDIPDQL